MFAPIYIHRVFFDRSLVVREQPPAIRNEFYVIDANGSAGDRIRVYNLPDLIDMFYHSSVFVAGSRLFIVGHSSYRGAEDAIFYIDYKNNGRWKKTALGDFEYLAGMAVLDGDRIHCFGVIGKNFSFMANDVQLKPSSFQPGPGRDRWLPISLAVTPEKRIYVFWYSGEVYGELGYYDECGKWYTIDAAAIWPRLSHSAVVFKDKYLITFADCHPITEDYGPNLYACDISVGKVCKWLDKPVKGLLHDGEALPDSNSEPCFEHTSVMRVSAVNFALIWSISGPGYPEDSLNPPFELHCTKFSVSIQDEDTDAPTLTAHFLSSVGYNSKDITLHVNSTTGNQL